MILNSLFISGKVRVTLQTSEENELLVTGRFEKSYHLGAPQPDNSSQELYLEPQPPELRFLSQLQLPELE